MPWRRSSSSRSACSGFAPAMTASWSSAPPLSFALGALSRPCIPACQPPHLSWARHDGVPPGPRAHPSAVLHPHAHLSIVCRAVLRSPMLDPKNVRMFYASSPIAFSRGNCVNISRSGPWNRSDPTLMFRSRPTSEKEATGGFRGTWGTALLGCARSGCRARCCRGPACRALSSSAGKLSPSAGPAAVRAHRVCARCRRSARPCLRAG